MSLEAMVFQTSSFFGGGESTGVGFAAFAWLLPRLASSSSCLLAGGAWFLDDDERDRLRFRRERVARLP